MRTFPNCFLTKNSAVSSKMRIWWLSRSSSVGVWIGMVSTFQKRLSSSVHSKYACCMMVSLTPSGVSIKGVSVQGDVFDGWVRVCKLIDVKCVLVFSLERTCPNHHSAGMHFISLTVSIKCHHTGVVSHWNPHSNAPKVVPRCS